MADQLPALPAARIAAAAARLPGRTGAARVQRLVVSEDAHTRSELERRFVAYCDAHAVPHPAERNHRVHGFRVDCWYPAAKLVVELDSRAHHSRRQEREADNHRDRALAARGIETLRLGWHDLDPADPRAARDLRGQLSRRTGRAAA